MWREASYVSFLFFGILMAMGIMVYAYFYNIKQTIQGIISLGISFLIFLTLPLHQEKQLFIPQANYTIEGVIQEVRTTNYYQWITLKSVKVEPGVKKLHGKVQIRLPLTEEVSVYDEIRVVAECLEIDPPMNPSDFDYGMYLNGQQIVASFKLQECLIYEVHTPILEKIKVYLTRQLEKLFHPEKVGIMEAALLGDDSKLNEKTKSLYQMAGISHVICISGFHVGVVMGALMFVIQQFKIPYTARQFILMAAIWGYALLTGLGASTVRAVVMMSVVLLGNALWQESDRLTNLALAAWILLIQNPYQLYMVGFQLSFGAVLGITICMEQIEKKELPVEWKYKGWQKTLMVWGSVQCFTTPILAYHFYEVPFLLSLLNLIIIPIFSGIIIGGAGLMVLSFILPSVAQIGSCVIEWVLISIEAVLEILTQLPYATLVIGKPSIGELLFYMGAVCLLGAWVWGYYSKKRILQAGLVLIGYYISCLCWTPKNLRLTSLYVGQGDCMVVEVPDYGVLVVDGGNFGQGETVENYVKYLGYNRIEGIMVSHSDSDHIGGILELLESNMEIGHCFISESDASTHLNDLIENCQLEQIPIHALKKGETIQYGELCLECLSPNIENINGSKNNLNDHSIVCTMRYGDFSALLTGDQTKDTYDYDKLPPITLLKVSHHGSRTGTSEDMLTKLSPQYAIISCGQDNRYGHPHQEVIELLEESHVQIQRTDEEGAIFYETDGKYFKETCYRNKSS